jgi:hypothetical protein
MTKSIGIDKIILNAYWLYRDNLISKDAFIDVIERMKEAERKREETNRLILLEEDTKKAEETGSPIKLKEKKK